MILLPCACFLVIRGFSSAVRRGTPVVHPFVSEERLQRDDGRRALQLDLDQLFHGGARPARRIPDRVDHFPHESSRASLRRRVACGSCCCCRRGSPRSAGYASSRSTASCTGSASGRHSSPTRSGAVRGRAPTRTAQRAVLLSSDHRRVARPRRGVRGRGARARSGTLRSHPRRRADHRPGDHVGVGDRVC